jgi:hypothetical protein
MWLTGLCLAAGLSGFGVPGASVATPPLVGGPSARPTLTAELFIERWPVSYDGIEKPHLREKLRRLVQITPNDDPGKARFWFELAKEETARWRSLQEQARVLAARADEAPATGRGALDRESRMLVGRADWSWEAAAAAYASAAAFPTFERRDAAVYWLARLYLARP